MSGRSSSKPAAAAKTRKPAKRGLGRPEVKAHQKIVMKRSKLLHLLIHGKTQDRPIIVCVDTGAAACVIASESSAKFEITGVSTTKEIGGLGSAEMIADTGVCHDLDLGGFIVPNFKVMIASLAHVHTYLKKAGEEPYDMILGCDFLIGHRAVIDCLSATLWLHPDYEEPIEVAQKTLEEKVTPDPLAVEPLAGAG